jgi:hypothetical protein
VSERQAVIEEIKVLPGAIREVRLHDQKTPAVTKDTMYFIKALKNIFASLKVLVHIACEYSV